ncbi:MAG: DUF4340 domain-containing protein [Brevinematales bacterium]|nr:DUF4340 domain-containing protein [Brevinematales bacterium]
MRKKYLYLSISFLSFFVLWLISGFFVERTKSPRYPKINGFVNISKIEITSSTNSIVLFNSNNNWYISPENYELDADIAKELFGLLSNFAIVDVVGKVENISSFELDAKSRIKVKISDNKKEHIIYFGKTATTKKHTYLILSNDDNIYLGKGDFYSVLHKPTGEYRSRQILHFKNEDLVSISWNEGGKIFEVYPENGGFKGSWKETKLDSKKFGDFILVINPLYAIDFPQKIPSKNILRKINIKTKNSNFNIIIYDKDNEGDYYVELEGKKEFYKITGFAGNILLRSYTNY